MLIHILPALIMFAITVAFVTVFFVPAAAFPQKNELINFYWVGIWVFLGVIAALSGGNQTLGLMDVNTNIVANGVLSAITLCFIIFVVFAWFRLSATAIWAGLRHAKARIG